MNKKILKIVGSVLESCRVSDLKNNNTRPRFFFMKTVFVSRNR